MTVTEPFTTDPALIAGRYTAVCGEPDARLRRAAITEIWAEGGVEFVDGARFHGYEELDARVTGAYTEFVGSGRYTVSHAGDVARHHDIITFTVQLLSTGDGEVAWSARVFALVDEHGVILEDYQLTVQPLAV